MKQLALGMIEVFGLVAAIEAADVALKTAAVELVNLEQVKSGRIMVAVVGEVAAVQAAVSAGSTAAAKINVVFAEHVIPRPMANPELLINSRGKEDVSQEGADKCSEDVPVNKSVDTTSAEEERLQVKSVKELRTLARQTEGIAIVGRQISRANKEQLILEIMRAKGMQK